MVVGEDKNKVWLAVGDSKTSFNTFSQQVANIVRPQIERFRQLYKSRVAFSKEFLQVLQHILDVNEKFTSNIAAEPPVDSEFRKGNKRALPCHASFV